MSPIHYNKIIVESWKRELNIFLKLMGDTSDEDNPDLGTKPYYPYIEKIQLENFKRLSKELLDYCLEPKEFDKEVELAIPEELKEKVKEKPTGRIFFEDADPKLVELFWRKARRYYKKGSKKSIKTLVGNYVRHYNIEMNYYDVMDKLEQESNDDKEIVEDNK